MTTKYTLSNPKGVGKLLRDFNGLSARRYDKADYAASDIIIDLLAAIHDANLTDRQLEAVNLVYIEDLTQEKAGERMGVTQQAVQMFVDGALKRIAAVYKAWDYGEVEVLAEEDNDNNEGGRNIDE